MRTVLLTSVAALGFACAAGAHGQTPTPPAGAMEQSAPAAPQAPTSDETAPQPAPQTTRHQHVRRVAATTNAGTDDGSEGHWAHQPGTGQSGPASNKASNIDSADTRSVIAPHLPQPAVGESGGPQDYLQAAKTALDSHKTGAAQQALEMAETRLLDRSTAVSASEQPDHDAVVQQVADARRALASGDTTGASSAIAIALNAGGK